MPLLDFLATSNTFRQWLATTNNLISTISNTSVFVLVSQNATPNTTTGNVSINGTMTIATVTANGTVTANVFSGNGVSLTTLNASALATGTVPLGRLSSANSSANGVVDTTTQSFAGNKTFDNNVAITGYLTVGNNTITLNSTTLIVGNSAANLVFTSSGITKDGVTIINESGSANNATYAFGKTEGALNVNSATTATTANNSTYAFGKTEGALNVNSAATATQATNATNLNSQPGSYYTNASNLATGTLAIARLDANVILTTSTTGMNASALSTGTVPDARLSGTYTLITANNSTYAFGKTEGALNVNSASQATNATNLNSQPGSYYTNASNLATGTVPSARLSGTYTLITANNATYAFGKTEGNLNVNSATQATNATNLNSQPGSYYTNASNLATGTVPLAQLTSANSSANGIVDTTTQTFAGNKTFQNTTAFSNTVSITGAANALSTLGVGGTLNALGLLGVSGNATFAQDVTVSGNLTISGTTTYINTTNLQIGDNIIALNADLPGVSAPTENAGLEINRGSSANTYLRWNETSDRWEFTNDGTNYSNVVTVAESTNASNLATGTVPDARLSGTYTLITANNATYAFGKTEGNLNVNSATQATNSTNLNSQPGSYYTNASNLSTGTLLNARLAGAYTGVTSLTIGANVVANVTTLFVGNSTANSVHTATSLSVANSTNTATLTPISLTIGSQVVNTSQMRAVSALVIPVGVNKYAT